MTDFTIELGINTLTAVAQLQKLGTMTDQVFSKERKINLDDSALKQFSTNMVGVFEKANKALNFDNAFDDANDQVLQLEKALQGAVLAFGKTSPITDGLVKDLIAAKQKAQEFTDALDFVDSIKADLTIADQLDASKKKAKDLENELAKVIATQGKGSPAYQQTVEKLKAAKQEAAQLEGYLQEAGDAAQDIQPPSGGGSFFGNFTNQVKEARDQASAGGGIFGDIAGKIGGLVSPVGLATAAAGGLAAGLAATFKVGQEFETNLKSVSAVTGVTGAGLDDIGNRAQKLAAQFGGTASDQLGVFQTTLSKIGPQLAQDSGALSTFAENVNTLSKTDSALGAAGAVDALTSSMLQFGVDVNNSNEVARESSRFINVLAASAGVGSASVSQVAEAVAVVGATAKNANVSFEETNAALQVLASKSLLGSQAGTGLTSVLVKLQSQSQDGDKALKKLGTSSAELGKLLNEGGIGAAMGKLREAMNKVGSAAEKNALLNKLFGEGGQNAAAALLSSGDMLSKWTKDVAGTNAATEQAAINMSTLSERIGRGTAVLSNIAVNIYQAIIPVINQVFSFFDEITQAISPTLTRLYNVFSQTFTEIASIVKPVLAVIGGLIGANILLVINGLIGAISAVTGYISTFVSRVKESLQPVFESITKLFGGAGDSALKLSDIFAAFGQLVYITSDILGEAGSIIAEFLVTPIQFLANTIKNIITFFTSFTSGTKDAAKTSKELGDATSKNVGFFTKLIDIITTIPNYLAGFRGAFNAVKQTLLEFSSILSNVFNDGLGGTFDKIVKLFNEFGGKVSTEFTKEFTEKTYDKLTASFAELEVEAPKLKLEDALQQINEFASRSKKEFEAGKLTADQYGALAKKVTALSESVRKTSQSVAEATKAGAEAVAKEAVSEEELIKRAKERLDAKKAAFETEFKQLSVTLADLAASEKRELSEAEKTRLAEKRLETDEKIAALTKEIYKIITDNKGIATEVRFSMPANAKTDILNSFLDLQNSIANQKITLGKVSFDKDALSKELEKIINSFDDVRIESAVISTFQIDADNTQALEITRDFGRMLSEAAAEGVGTAVPGIVATQLDNELALAQQKIDALNTFIADTTAKLNNTTDDAEKKRLEGLISNAKKAAESTAKARLDAEAKASDALFKRRLVLAQDADERELIQKTQALAKELADTLSGASLTATEKLIIQRRYLQKEQALIAEYRRKNERGFVRGLEDAALSALSAITEVFSQPIDLTQFFNIEDVNKQIGDLMAQQDELFKQLQEGRISFEDYQSSIADIGTQLDELREQAEGPSFADILLSNSIKAFEGVEKGLINLNTKLLEQQASYLDEKLRLEREIQREIQDASDSTSDKYIKNAEEREKFIKAKNKEIEKSEKKLTDVSTQMYATMAVEVSASLGKLVAEGKPFLQALAIAVIDAAQAMVPAFVFMITGFSLASAESVATAGILGLAKAAVVTALLYAALGALRGAAAKEFGFKDGGEIGLHDGIKVGGRQFVMVNETGESEFVVNARSYQQNRELLDYINKGGKAEHFLASRQLSNTVVTPSGSLRSTNTAAIRVYEKLPAIHEQTLLAINTNFALQQQNNNEMAKEIRSLRKEIRALAQNYESHSYGHLDVSFDKGVLLKKVESDIKINKVR